MLRPMGEPPGPFETALALSARGRSFWKESLGDGGLNVPSEFLSLTLAGRAGHLTNGVACAIGSPQD